MECLKLSFTCRPAAQGYLQNVQVPWQYRRSRRSSDRCLPCTGAFSRSAASWAMALYGAPSTNGTLHTGVSFAALSAGSSAGGTSHTSTASCAVHRADDIPALWQLIMGFPSLGYLHIQVSLPRLMLWWRSPRAPSAGGTLHTGTIRSVFGRWCLRQWRSSTALSWPTGCPHSSSSGG